MNQESKSLSRLIANLESDPDIQKAVRAKPAKQHTTDRLNAVKEAVFQKVQHTLAARPEAAATESARLAANTVPFDLSPAHLPLAAAPASEGNMEFEVVGISGVRLIVRHQTARLAVYDDNGEPSTRLSDHRIFGRTPDKTDLQDLGFISGWKAALPPGATVEHLLSPDGGYKLTLTSVPPV